MTTLLIPGFALLAGSLLSQTIFSCMIFAFSFLPIRDLADFRLSPPAFQSLRLEAIGIGVLLLVPGDFFHSPHKGAIKIQPF